MIKQTNPRVRALTIVGLVVTFLTLFFLILFVRQQNLRTSELITSEQRSQQTQFELLLDQVSQSYKSRLISFVTNRTKVMNAFAAGDRDELLRRAKPIQTLLKKENPYFWSIFFTNPDNSMFLRVQKPKLFDDDLTDFSPIVPEGNRTRKMLAGFEIVKPGLQYRIVQPLFVDGKYIGLVGFSIDADLFLDHLAPCLSHAHQDEQTRPSIALLIPKRESSKIVFKPKKAQFIGDNALLSDDKSHFHDIAEPILVQVLEGTARQVKLHGTNHALIHGATFNDLPD